MDEYRIDPLQDATEHLRTTYRTIRYDVGRYLSAETPALCAAIERVIAIADGSHIPPPELAENERQPQDVPDAGLYSDAIFDEAVPPRRLSDVWEGRGDYDDPFKPTEDDTEAAAKHDADLIAKRMREDSDKTLDYQFRRV